MGNDQSTRNYIQKLAKVDRATSIIFSIPWCCIVSLGIAFFTTTGSLLGFFFDELMHDAIYFLVVFHIYGIIRYLRDKEKTYGRTVFLVSTTLLFFVSVGFHFTELHDEILTAP